MLRRIHPERGHHEAGRVGGAGPGETGMHVRVAPPLLAVGTVLHDPGPGGLGPLAAGQEAAREQGVGRAVGVGAHTVECPPFVVVRHDLRLVGVAEFALGAEAEEVEPQDVERLRPLAGAAGLEPRVAAVRPEVEVAVDHDLTAAHDPRQPRLLFVVLHPAVVVGVEPVHRRLPVLSLAAGRGVGHPRHPLPTYLLVERRAAGRHRAIHEHELPAVAGHYPSARVVVGLGEDDAVLLAGPQDGAVGPPGALVIIHDVADVVGVDLLRVLGVERASGRIGHRAEEILEERAVGVPGRVALREPVVLGDPQPAALVHGDRVGIEHRGGVEGVEQRPPAGLAELLHGLA